MADKDQDAALREATRARGFRLVKSRRRKPGGDFGLYGLVGADSGRECLGFGPDGLTANAEQVLAYLRGGEVASWKRSLIGVVGADVLRGDEGPSPAKGAARNAQPPTEKPRKSETAGMDPGLRRGAEKARPARPSPRLKAVGGEAGEEKERGKDEAAPLAIREATRRDAAALAQLLGVPAATLAERLTAAIKGDEPPLIAARGEAVIGVAGWSILASLHQDPRGRITLLHVAEAERRQGVGTSLLDAVAQRLADAGMAEVELLLDIGFDAPTAFLRRTGWERRTNGFERQVTI